MRLSYDVLDAMLEQLSNKLIEGVISLDTYFVEFDRIVNFAGWTERQLLQEIDKRWTERMRARQTFLC